MTGKAVYFSPISTVTSDAAAPRSTRTVELGPVPAGEGVEQTPWRLERLAIERNEHVTDEQALPVPRGFLPSRAQRSTPAACPSLWPLARRELGRPAPPRRGTGAFARPCVINDSIVFATMPAGITTPRTANLGGGRDPEQRTVRVDERAARKSPVHRRGGPDDFFDRATAPCRQRSADDRDNACAGSECVAPRSARSRPRCDRRAAPRQSRGWKIQPSARNATRCVAGSQPMRSASTSRPSGVRTESPSSRPIARVVVTMMSVLWTTPLAGCRRP
jgi:hypothetical protein